MTAQTQRLIEGLGVIRLQRPKPPRAVVLQPRNPDGTPFVGVVRGRIAQERHELAERQRIAGEQAASDEQERSDLAAGFAALRRQIAARDAEHQAATAPPPPVYL